MSAVADLSKAPVDAAQGLGCAAGGLVGRGPSAGLGEAVLLSLCAASPGCASGRGGSSTLLVEAAAVAGAVVAAAGLAPAPAEAAAAEAFAFAETAAGTAAETAAPPVR